MASQTGQNEANGRGTVKEKPNGDQNASTSAPAGEKQGEGRMTSSGQDEVTPEKGDAKSSTFADKLKQKLMPPEWVLSNAKQLKVRSFRRNGISERLPPLAKQG